MRRHLSPLQRFRRILFFELATVDSFNAAQVITMVAVHYKGSLPLRQAKVSAITAMLSNNDETFDNDNEMPMTMTVKKASTFKRNLPQRNIESVSGTFVVPPAPHVIRGTISKTPRKSSRHKNRDTFPVKLWKLLEKGDCEEAICWTTHGKEFVIRNKTLLEEALPRAGFAHSGVRSFHRQLSYWCFTRLSKDPEQEVWVHPHFFKGMSRSALASVIRISHKGNPVRRKGMTLEESAAQNTMADEDVSTTRTLSSEEKTAPTSNETTIEGRDFFFPPRQSITLQPRRIEFEKDPLDLSSNLMSAEETSSIRIPASTMEEIGPTTFVHHESVTMRGLEGLQRADWCPFGVPYVAEVEEDILCTLPFNETGTISLSDEEDCMSLDDFSFLESTWDTTVLTAEV